MMAEFIEPGASDYDRRWKAAEPRPSEVADILLAAADLIEVDGWTQGVYHDNDGCHCALGALGVASGFHVLGIDPDLIAEAERDGVPVEEIADLDAEAAPFYTPVGADYLPAWRRYEEADKAVREVIGNNFVPNWNDEPGQKAERVVEVLRDAAAKALAL